MVIARVLLSRASSKKLLNFRLFKPKICLWHSISEMKCLRFSKVGQFKILIRSSYSIFPCFCPSARRDALLWTFSSASTSFTSYGHHTGAAYPRIGRTKVMYKIEHVS